MHAECFVVKMNIVRARFLSHRSKDFFWKSVCVRVFSFVDFKQSFKQSRKTRRLEQWLITFLGRFSMKKISHLMLYFNWRERKTKEIINEYDNE